MNATEEIEAINRYIGIPYIRGGTTAHGCDCIGFALLFIEHELGIVIPRPHCKTLAEALASPLCDRFDETDAPRFGDVALMQSDEEGISHHAGIFTRRGILHSHRGRGVVLTITRLSRVESYWRPRQ